MTIGAILGIFMSFPAGHVLLGTQGMSCWEHRECLVWNIGNVLHGTLEISCLEHKEYDAVDLSLLLKMHSEYSRASS